MASPEHPLYKPDLYKEREKRDTDLLIQITSLFVQLEKVAGDKYGIYKSVLYSENGAPVLDILLRLGATTHLEIKNLTGISQPSANYNLQKLIQIGFVQVRPIIGDPQLKTKFRPFNIYAITDTDPDDVVKAHQRFKKLLLKGKLNENAYNAYDNIKDFAVQVLELHKKPGREHYLRVLVNNGIKTEEEWDILLPQLVRAVKEVA